MSTDIPAINEMRDRNPNDIVTICFNGDPAEGARVEEILAQYDAAIVQARAEGARLMLDRIGAKAYVIESEGRFDAFPGTFHDGFVTTIAGILEVEGSALDENRVDFTVAPE